MYKLTTQTNYTRLLNEGFRNSRKPVDIILFCSKGERITDLPNVQNVWSSTLYPFQIFRQVLRDRLNIVHIQQEFDTFGPFWTTLLVPLALLLTKIAHARTVVTCHAVIPKEMVDQDLVRRLFPPISKAGVGGILLKMLLTYIYGAVVVTADRLVVHGAWYKKQLTNSYKADPCKISIIPYGVNEKGKIDRTLLKKWRKRVGKHRIILFFGSITPRKDILGLIRAFAVFLKSHRSYLLIIGGNEPPYYREYSSNLKSIVKELGISNNVIFAGFVSDKEIHVLYSVSEFVVFPYLYGFEGPSGPLAFALEHGVPIIGTKVGHLREEIRNNKEGILVPPKDVNAITQAMIKLAEDGDLRDRLSENLRRKGRTMYWRIAATRTFNLYKELMDHSELKRSATK